jgi:hypothetical protein
MSDMGEEEAMAVATFADRRPLPGYPATNFNTDRAAAAPQGESLGQQRAFPDAARPSLS